MDHHPICIRTIDLQWVTGGGGCVPDTHRKKLWSCTSCPVKKVLLLSSACDAIVVCFVICLPEEFIGKPHILSHVLSEWMSHHIDLPRYLRHFRISGSKHLPRVWIRRWKKRANDSFWWHVMFKKILLFFLIFIWKIKCVRICCWTLLKFCSRFKIFWRKMSARHCAQKNSVWNFSPAYFKLLLAPSKKLKLCFEGQTWRIGAGPGQSSGTSFRLEII